MREREREGCSPFNTIVYISIKLKIWRVLRYKSEPKNSKFPQTRARKRTSSSTETETETETEIDSRKGSDKKAELTSSSNRRHVILRGIVFLHGREELPR